MIDIACPFGIRIESKEAERSDHYQDLKREIKTIWKLKEATIVLIIVGSLGTVHKNIKDWINRLEIPCSVVLLQKAAMLGTAQMVRKVLGPRKLSVLACHPRRNQ